MATGRRGARGEGVFSARSRKSDVVTDAVLLATAAVRIAVKNLLIVRALREHADYEEHWWRDAVAREFEVLAGESEADATRLEGVRAETKKKVGRALTPRRLPGARCAGAEAPHPHSAQNRHPAARDRHG